MFVSRPVYLSAPFGAVFSLGLIYFDVSIDVLAADERIVEDVGEHGDDEPVAANRAEAFSYRLLNEWHDATTDDHHHEEAGSLSRVLAESLDRKVEDAAPHD